MLGTKGHRAERFCTEYAPKIAPKATLVPVGKKRRAHGEGSVYFDSTRGRWVGQAWIDGRRRKVSARTKVDATAALGRLIHGDESERHVDKRLTVAQLLETWDRKALASRDLAPSTLDRHRWAVRLLTKELGKAKAANVDVQAVEKALERLAAGSQGQPLSRASLVKVRNTLRQSFAWAERRRAVSFNPAHHAELPAGAADATPRRALDRDELERLFVALEDHPLGAMFATCAQLGLRPGEAAALCADAIDLEAGVLSVVRNAQMRPGGPRLTDELKTAGSRRSLEAPASLIERLRAHIESSPPGDGLLWPASDGGPLWPTTVRVELREMCKAASIDPPIRPNELRHTCATLLANDGVPPHVLADLLGHTSTRMVDAYYRHRPAIIRTGTMGVEL